MSQKGGPVWAALLLWKLGAKLGLGDRQCDALVTAGLAADDLDRSFRNSKLLGQQSDHRGIGLSVGRRRGDTDLQLFTTVGRYSPATDSRP